eukprot:c7877_g1_i1.p1 GENE.c7877_g1_i1~~c7877_g1_i1.p1  ORF type:complete len:118 (-),score=18.39 c7877_g1_i1:71-424(-)
MEEQPMKVWQYDLKMINTAFFNALLSVLVISVLHFYGNVIHPLVAQVPLALLNSYENPLFQIYFLGSTKITRPFSKTESPEGTETQPTTTNTTKDTKNTKAKPATATLSEKDRAKWD